MKRKILLMIMICCVIYGITVFSVPDNPLVVNIVDYTLRGWNGLINSSLDYPLVSVDDHTYIAVRDVAKLLDREVVWHDASESISFIKYPSEKYLIDDEKTAMAIGRAVAQQFYVDRITVNSVETIGFTSITSAEMDDFWCYYLMFEKPTDRIFDLGSLVKNDENIEDFIFLVENSDVEIRISPYDGSVKIFERQENGKMEQLEKK